DLQVELAGQNLKSIFPGDCTNYGTIHWVNGGGNLDTLSGRFVNHGKLVVQTNAAIFSAQFLNYGLLELNRGTLTIGNYQADLCHFSPDSVIQIDIGGPPSAGQESGSLGFWYTAPLAGTLKVMLTNGYQPSAGAVYTLVSYPSADGSFSSVQLPALSPSLG